MYENGNVTYLDILLQASSMDDILNKADYVYFLLNKPRGVISSAADDKKRKTVVDLIDTDKRIYPIGRLDYDTTGLLLLTNDGELANLLMHPKNKIDKVYFDVLTNELIRLNIEILNFRKNYIDKINYFLLFVRKRLLFHLPNNLKHTGQIS